MCRWRLKDPQECGGVSPLFHNSYSSSQPQTFETLCAFQEIKENKNIADV